MGHDEDKLDINAVGESDALDMDGENEDDVDINGRTMMITMTCQW